MNQNPDEIKNDNFDNYKIFFKFLHGNKTQVKSRQTSNWEEIFAMYIIDERLTYL